MDWSAWGKHIKHEGVIALRDFRFVYVGLAFYFLAFLISSKIAGVAVDVTIDKLYAPLQKLFHLIFFIYVGFCYVVRVLQVLVERKRIFYNLWHMTLSFFSVRHAFCFLLFVACYAPFAVALLGLKSLIPYHHPFDMDPMLQRMDLLLGFGQTPWQIIHGLVGSSTFLRATDLAYNIWFVVIQMAFTHQFFSKRRDLANQYLLSCFLMWFLLGHITAIVFSSVGPCFYHWLGALPKAHLEMTAFIDGVNAHHALMVHKVQSSLAPYLVPKNHISAFPSMHVACITLVACYASQARLLPFIVTLCYAAWILVGSVYLGWHYLSDGLFSIAGTCLIWKGVGGFIARRPAMQ